MAENNHGQSLSPPELPPRLRRNNIPNDEIYEEVNAYASTELGQIHEESYSTYSQSERASVYETPSASLQYDTDMFVGRRNRGETGSLPDSYENDYTDINAATRRDSYDYSRYYLRTDPDEIFRKTHRFKNKPKEFIDVFESTKDEIRTDEETFIIVHLLGRNKNKSPILDGRLDQMAMLSCCSSPHVVKRALDTLLHEIFLSISDFSSVRCRNLLEAEEELRSSFSKFLKVDNDEAKSQRMTAYAWLVTFVLLKCNVDEFTEIQPRIREFDKILDALQNNKEYSERNNFRYGIYLARESIRRIINSSEKNFSASLKNNIKRCETILNGRMGDGEVLKLSKSLADASWLDLHVCLVFLQDLTKFYRFEGDKKPIILIQMLVADHRKRCSSTRLRALNTFRSHSYERWLFEILVYHVMLRLIRTSTNKEIIQQVLVGQQGCGGILKRTLFIQKKKPTEQLAIMLQEKLCQRAVFVSDPSIFNQFLTDNCNSRGDEKRFIEDLSILHISSSYKDKIFVISTESRIRISKKCVITYDCLISGRKCLLKLHQHSKEELLRTDALKTVPLRNEIQILRILSTKEGSPRNIVQLFGSSINAPMYMIIERTPKTDLLSFLEDFSNPPKAHVLHQISQDICTAMVYLHQHDIIHRDLRAKNCFIFMHDGELITKLGDFHLAILSYSGPKSPTHFIDRKTSVKSIPDEDIPNQFALRWMAIEVLQFGEFSPASDVWSFGVLLSEIFTFGCKPYTNMPNGLSLDSEKEVHDYILAGKRLELHPRIPEQIQRLIGYTMMDVDRRPTFSQVKDNLIDMVEMNAADTFYNDPAHYRISHSAKSRESGEMPNPKAGCSVKGCFGDCLNASDIAIATKVHVDGSLVDCIKQFVPASPDLLKIPKHPSLAAVTNMAIHYENLELVTEAGDYNLETFINTFGCPLENAKEYLSHIGEAISYLHKNRFIHRNLRATSVFIFMSGRAKLGCFARVRRLKPNLLDQSLTVPIHLPIPSGDSFRWSSPEVIIDGKYSEASDVWAFAVLIWEMFTLMALNDDEILYDDKDKKASSLPYNDLKSKEQILSYLDTKNRLDQPKSCPEWLYQKMELCWEYYADDRPKCEDILQSINNQIQSTSEQDQHE